MVLLTRRIVNAAASATLMSLPKIFRLAYNICNDTRFAVMFADQLESTNFNIYHSVSD